MVGIDPQKFTDSLQKEEVQNRIRELDEKYKDVKVILGVDRLDYIKGLTQKLKGFDAFLDNHKQWRGKVVLIQVAVPSREEVKEYQELESEISTIVGKINGKYGKKISVFPSSASTADDNSHPRLYPPDIHAPLHPLHRAHGALLHLRRLPARLDP